MRLVSTLPSKRRPAPIKPLSVLPVFMNLAGRDVLLAGGTQAVAWKAELLVAAGARVKLVAPQAEMDEETMRLILATERATLLHHDRTWRSSDLETAVVAIADAADEEEAQSFAAAARRAGVPCNVIDRPEHCSFQFGSIVNRSPVVVGISTSGAAPVLGQAVRRRIETLLPPTLAAWAAFAGRMRGVICRANASGARRRAFWEAFVDAAFGAPPAPDDAAAYRLLNTQAAGGAPSSGRVTFVGAGPGDPEHLTLKAVRALQAADVILFDDLVSDAVLELARREAKRILVGKRAGRPSCRQHEINGMMITLARSGRHVVRLKSGDPAIFGRGGEEIEALQAQGIPFTVVPGISAGPALAASLGISLTHRDAARQVRFITGHSKHGGLPSDIDLPGILHPSATTIVYMGGRTARELSSRLIALGMAPATSVAVGVALGRPEERLGFATLDTLAAYVENAGLNNPIVIGIGKVFQQAAAAKRPAEEPSFRARHV
ncbi:siroheme synthase CysG [Nitratireductor sp. ZSWI3]|uniref:siroheme synthase CysG n=1 Tax=Nitratireductor sp. ZSWI3 TaxID=2966359 RepID=UPI0021506385|nr:siroheme synthase CysG [Nitratireductor sp. ZSWI3]MCR4264624.1 siroheme synthase CysG [Nitratireductor sp. ZSWI3]